MNRTIARIYIRLASFARTPTYTGRPESATRLENAQSQLRQEPARGAVEKHPRQHMEHGRRAVIRAALTARRNHVGQHLAGTLAEAIEHGGLMHARNGAIGRAGFRAGGFAFEIFDSVALERDSGLTALLRAVVDQAVLADVEETSAGPAVPAVGQTSRDILLKTVVLREGKHLLIGFEDLVVDR